jgi:hypothetical protein
MLRGIVHAIPLNSGVVESLMRAHIADDDRSAAETVYQGTRRRARPSRSSAIPDDQVEQLRLDLGDPELHSSGSSSMESK